MKQLDEIIISLGTRRRGVFSSGLQSLTGFLFFFSLKIVSVI